MLHPLENLDNTTFNHYQLQLSLYFWMIKQQFPEVILDKLMLYHIDHDNQTHVMQCTYLENEVERLLKTYKKQMKIKAASDKLKPFIK